MYALCHGRVRLDLKFAHTRNANVAVDPACRLRSWIFVVPILLRRRISIACGVFDVHSIAGVGRQLIGCHYVGTIIIIIIGILYYFVLPLLLLSFYQMYYLSLLLTL
jgi:hypothetical protein